jgi:ribonuclease J
MSHLKITPLGGMSSVTQNMFLYEYQDELMIVDCGIGFPDQYMPGVDIMLPDISYVLKRLEEGAVLVGALLTHGHDDHIGALPYLSDSLPEFPIYGSPLTAGFAEQRLRDGGSSRMINTVNDNDAPIHIGQYFTAEFINVTHSVPDTRHIAITTPEGIIYHGSDFKLDPTPVDGLASDLDRIAEVAKRGVLCMLIDCLRVEKPTWTKSESMVGPTIAETMKDVRGKYIMTLMSSHLHRIQHTVEAAKQHNRKVVFVGRSVERNVEVALRLGKLTIPSDMLVDKKHIEDYDDSKLCVIIAGSQGQEGSSLMRAVYGEHRVIQIKPNDVVVFSADAIPGNELNYFGAIDELAKNRVHVLYPDVLPNLHQSGHASAPEQQELLGIVKPKYVMPIGGADRHRVKFLEFVAEPLGYNADQVLIPDDGDIIGFENGRPSIVDKITLKPQLIDGLGVGDVGPMVLSDRRSLSEAGMVVVVIPRMHGQFDLRSMEIVSRGFVFMKEADDVIKFIEENVAQTIDDASKGVKDDELKRTIERRLSRRLYKVIQREPVVMAVFMDV